MAAFMLPAHALPWKAARASVPAVSIGSVGALSFRSGVNGTATGLAGAAAVAPTSRPAHGVELALATPADPMTAPVSATAGNAPPADAEPPAVASRFLIACLAIGGFLAVRSRVRRI